MVKDAWPDWDVYVSKGCKCVYCGFDGANNFLSWRQLQIDHLIPQYAGGIDKPINKVVACSRCNSLKFKYDPSEGKDRKYEDKSWQKEMIGKVIHYLDSKIYEDKKDFDLMIEEIKKFNNKDIRTFGS